MFCTKCGSDNSDKAVFCRGCGTRIDHEEETRVATRRSDQDEIRFEREGESVQPIEELTKVRNSPRVVSGDEPPTLNRRATDRENDDEEVEIFTVRPTLVFVKIGYIIAAVCALLLVAATSAFISYYVSIPLSVFIGMLLFLVPAYYHFRQKLRRYTLTDSKLEITQGLISQTTRNVPITRIQDVTVSATPWQRLLGIGDLIIDNASEQGGKLIMKDINSPKKYSEILLKQMRLLDR